MNIGEDAVLEKSGGKNEKLLACAMEMMHSTFYRIACIDLLENSAETIEIAADEQYQEELFLRDYGAEIKKFAEEYIPDDCREQFLNLMEPGNMTRLFDSGLPYASITYRRRESGKIKWVRSELIPMKDYSPEKKRVMWYVKNIPEEQAADERFSDSRIRMSEEMLDQVVRMLSSGVLAYSMPDREIIALNDEAKRIFDWNKSDVEQFSFSDIVMERIFHEDIPAVREAVKGLNGPGSSVEYDFRVVHRNGKTVRAHVRTAYLQFEDGTKFILSTLNDITEQSMLNDMLREERSQYRDALTSDCVYAYSADLTEGMVRERDITDKGAILMRMFNIRSFILYDELINRWVKERKPTLLGGATVRAMKKAALLEKYKNGEKSTVLEYYDPLADKYIRLTMLLSENVNTGNIMAFIYGTDITESRREEERAKQALVEAYEAAKRASSAKTDFLSRMSHDIRTPMNAIIGMTAIAAANLDDSEKVSDCLDKITVSSSHLLSLINEILDMSKIEAGKMELQEAEFSLSDFVDGIISIIRPQSDAKKQELKVTVSGVEHENVIGDDLRMQQAFLNLLSNAVKYTPEGGRISLYITEKKESRTDVGLFEFVFRDNGIGMSPEFVKHIFEPFTRETDSRVSKVKGTGLGMAITSNLIRMMNGVIDVESVPGQGSVFTVSLPMKLQTADGADEDKFSGLSVLIADDDPAACESAALMLSELGIKSEWVTSGEEAIEKVSARHKKGEDISAVILDWKMPGKDGVETARDIRAIAGSKVPIIIISAYDWSEIETEARRAGANAFVGKPLFRSRLIRLFRQLVEKEEKPEAENGVSDIEKASYPGKRVLLAEDNDLNAEITKEILRMMGIETERAENGKIAADMFEASESGYYDLIFMDIQMPVMDGNDAARAIRAAGHPDAGLIPIVAMTANAFADDIQAALGAGMNDHLAKPLNMKLLVSALDKWLK